MTSIQPLAGYVVVKRTEVPSETNSGIVLADPSKQEKPQKGEVLAIGPGKDGKECQVKVGQTILFKKYGPSELEHEGVEVLLLEEEDIFAILT